MSGDCFSVKDALAMKNYTNCDGILVSRGALHNPALFESIKANWDKYSVE